jgi:hypothetical protein
MISKLKNDFLQGLALVPKMCAFIVKMLPMVGVMLIPYLVLNVVTNNIPKLPESSTEFKGWGPFWIHFLLGLSYITGTFFAAFMAQALVVSIVAARGFQILEGLETKSIWHFGLPQRWALNAHWSFCWSMFCTVAIVLTAIAAIPAFAPMLLGRPSADFTLTLLSKSLLGILVYTLILNRMMAIPMAISEAIAKENESAAGSIVQGSFKIKPQPKLMKRAMLLSKDRLLPALVAFSCTLLVLFPALHLEKWYWGTIVGGDLTSFQKFLKSISEGFRFFMFILALNFIAHWRWRSAQPTSQNNNQTDDQIDKVMRHSIVKRA